MKTNPLQQIRGFRWKCSCCTNSSNK